MDARPAGLGRQRTPKRTPAPVEKGLDAAGPVYSWWDRKRGREGMPMALAYVVFSEGG